MYVGVILATALVLGLLFLYFIYVTTPKSGQKKSKYHDQGISSHEIAPKWAEVRAMMQQGGPANYKQSIMESDKLVDRVLISKVRGETMGERLKNAKHLFSKETYDALWLAHKIRNRLAHDAEFEGLSSEAQLAVRNFEKALKELRVI